MRTNNNWLCQPASSRRPFESGPEHVRQQTQIRFAATASSAHAFAIAARFYRKVGARMLEATHSVARRITGLWPARHRVA